MLSHRLDFAPEFDLSAEVPAAAAVFLLRGEEGAEPYVSKTASLRRRLLRLLGPEEERSKRLNLRGRVRRIEYSLTGSDFESGLLLYKLLREVFPQSYRERLRLRMAPLIKLNLDNPYPRAYVTQRLGKLTARSRYYGPFAARAAAEKYLNDALDLFKMRRCDFDLDPDPAFPGCIYSEMKMCLAPCFKGCTDDEYAREVFRVEQFLDTAGESLERELAGERERASAELEFEQAAAIHARLEKAGGVTTGLPDIVRRIDRLDGVMVQRAPQPEAVALFPIRAGRIAEPLLFPLQQAQDGKSQSMESRLVEALAAAAPLAAATAQETMEHLALLRRWYYRSSKSGEIFFADDEGLLPLRRLVRGVSRVFRGERQELDPVEQKAREYWLARTRETPAADDADKG